MGYGAGNYDAWEYAIMPLLSGIVGWGTNALALEMTFWPIEFWGVELFRIEEQPWGLFGWQGIIPTRARKMASISIDLMMNRLLNISEQVKRLDPQRIAEVLEEPILLLMDSVINEVAAEYMPKTWSTLPQDVKDEIVLTASNEAPEFVRGFMSDMMEHIDDVLDMKDMGIKACVENKALINKIFLECGGKEFIFIRRSGFYFGFVFGLLQMTLWFFFNEKFLLPICGFLVGWATNYLALKVIFRPLEPVEVCGCCTVHGIFLKRKAEVAETFARVVCVEIVHTKAVWDAILTGPLHQNFNAMLRAHTLVFADKMMAGQLRPIALATLGAQRLAQMKEEIAHKVVAKMPTIVDRTYEYTQEAFGFESTIRERMNALSYAEFEGILHPAFEEDEITLIMIGGILGLLVGTIQLFAVFST